jgi:hypothetical protein
MSGPSPLVFELCTAIDQFHERVPNLSVSDVLAALGEVSIALRCPGGPKRSRSNVVRISDYKRGSIQPPAGHATPSILEMQSALVGKGRGQNGPASELA